MNRNRKLIQCGLEYADRLQMCLLPQTTSTAVLRGLWATIIWYGQCCHPPCSSCKVQWHKIQGASPTERHVKSLGGNEKIWCNEEKLGTKIVTPCHAHMNLVHLSLNHPLTRLFWKTTRPNNVSCKNHLTIESAFVALPARYPVIVVYVRSHVFGISSMSASSARSEQVAAAVCIIENRLPAMWNWIPPSTYNCTYLHISLVPPSECWLGARC